MKEISETEPIHEVTARRVTTEHESESLLGTDLHALIQSRGQRVDEVLPLGGPSRWRQRPGSFRLQFSDGSLCKGIVLPDTQRTREVVFILEVIAHLAVPRLIAHAGSAMLQEWIEGEPLTEVPLTPESLTSAGGLQGHLHSAALPRGGPYGDEFSDLPAWRDQGQENLAYIVETGLISESEEKLISELMVHHVPRNLSSGFIHKDFCAENMVQDRLERIFVVDNESLCVGPYDYDLARTWYRWDMTSEERMLYLAAYEENRSAAEFRAHFVYWGLVTLLRVVVFRLKTTGTPPLRALELLRLLLEGANRGIPGGDLMLRDYQSSE